MLSRILSPIYQILYKCGLQDLLAMISFMVHESLKWIFVDGLVTNDAKHEGQAKVPHLLLGFLWSSFLPARVDPSS